MTRRQLLSGLAAAAVLPLAACTDRPGPVPTVAPTGSAEVSPTRSRLPFGLRSPSTVEAVIFDGAFGLTYVDEAAKTLEEMHQGVTVKVVASSDVTADVLERFDDGATPPDLIDNAGANRLALGSIAGKLLRLDELIASTNLDGDVIADTLYHGALESGTFNGRLVALDYALSTYGLWYSATTFAERGWSVPTEWDEMLALGEEAKREDLHLFVWGDEAAAYYAELAIASAIKEGGHEVRVALDNLDSDGWSHPAVTGVLAAMETCVREGYVTHGGDYMAAQAEWSRMGRALLYPSGAWIAKEMLLATNPTFEMTVAPVPTLTAAPTLPQVAIHAAPTEQFIVPRKAANIAGGLELLRVLLSREAAEEFARTNLIPTVVRNTSPADLQSSALTSQTRLLADAGEDVFSWRFIDHYGLGEDYNRLWGQFLSGQVGAVTLANRLQEISNAVREDPDVERYTVD